MAEKVARIQLTYALIKSLGILILVEMSLAGIGAEALSRTDGQTALASRLKMTIWRADLYGARV